MNAHQKNILTSVRKITLPWFTVTLISIFLVLISQNSPDIDAIYNEAASFHYTQIKIDYFSIFLLHYLTKLDLFQLRIIFFVIILIIFLQSKIKRNFNAYALALLLPMIFASQFRLFLAVSIFLLALDYFNSKGGFTKALLIASTFHFSFATVFLFPIFLISQELIMSFDFGFVTEILKVKVISYMNQEVLNIQFYARLPLIIFGTINLFVLIKKRSKRSILLGIYILIITFVSLDWWIMARRSFELVIFLSFPYFNQKKIAFGLLDIIYVASSTSYIALNTYKFVDLLDFK